jgi:pantothenate kinase
MVSDKGGKFGYVVKSRQNVYKALRRQGMSKEKAARIANAGRTASGRSASAKKAARTRKRRGK